MRIDEDNLRARIAYAQSVRMDIERFHQMFPALPGPETAMPIASWEALERQLTFLAATPERKAAVPGRISAFRKLAPYKPAEMVLQEILIEAWLLLEEAPASSDSREGAMS